MKNHEAEELHSELVGEVKDHSDTLKMWQKDIERNQSLMAEITKLESQLTQLKEANAELAKDKERLDKQEQMRWAVLFNTHNHKWTVQRVDQVVGNLGDGNSPRQAIDAAIAKGETQ